MEELEVKVSGRVQGVGFRYTIKKFADLSGLKGYIENKNDGSVEILVQGEDENLKRFLLFIRKNPGFSRIRSFNYKFRKLEVKCGDFRIIRKENFVLDKMNSVSNLGNSFLRKRFRK